ncbi:MAG: aminomethyl-transferring glycine dehydrogenase subunit GcvPB, partial [Bermanella sp.]
MLIFEQSHQGRASHAQLPRDTDAPSSLPADALRTTKPTLPEVSEMQVVRHYTRLSQKNFSIDTHFYPL